VQRHRFDAQMARTGEGERLMGGPQLAVGEGGACVGRPGKEENRPGSREHYPFFI
jgi:hypothetical protein